jgi:hypothetical protein
MNPNDVYISTRNQCVVQSIILNHVYTNTEIETIIKHEIQVAIQSLLQIMYSQLIISNCVDMQARTIIHST